MNLIKIVIVFSIVFFQATGTCEKITVREVQNLTIQPEGSYCLDWHKNNTLAIGGCSGTVTIITETKESNSTKIKKPKNQGPWDWCGVKNIYGAHNDIVKITKLSSDAKHLASVSFDNSIKIWHLKKQGNCITTLTHKNKTVFINSSFHETEKDQFVCIDWNPNPQYKNIIASGSKHFIKTYDIKNPEITVIKERFSVEIWDIKNPEMPIINQDFDDEVCCVRWHPDGKRLIVGLYGNIEKADFNSIYPVINGKLIKGRLALFDISINIPDKKYTMKEVAENKKDYDMHPGFLFFKNNETFLCGELGGHVKIHSLIDKDLTAGKAFKIKNEKKKALVRNITYNLATDITAAFCQEYCLFDRKPGYKNFIRFWKNNIYVGKIPLNTNEVSGMTFRLDGNYLAYVSVNGNIHILEIKKN